MLHFVDLSSYPARKNPDAVLAVYAALRNKRVFEDIQLVLKVKKGDAGAEDWLEPFRERGPEVVYLTNPMNALATRSLINCCDCFASLHRAEGSAEARARPCRSVGLPWRRVVGNLDYMTREFTVVDYRLVSVGLDEYPFSDGQVWRIPTSIMPCAARAVIADPPRGGR